jgi:hypothetical protein
MRRAVLITLLSLVPMLALPGLPARAGAVVDRRVELRGIWKVAGGAAAEARFRVLCQPDDGFTNLSIGLREGENNIASGTISPVPCTGEVEHVVVALQDPVGSDPTPVLKGKAFVYSNLWNCIDGRDPCFEMEQETPATVVSDSFVTPFDEDYRAVLDPVRTRLLADGRVRVVYDLTCEGTGFTPTPVASTITQVTPRGRLVYGTGFKPRDGSDVECGADPTRFRYLVTPVSGRFREGVSFIDTHFGSRYDWGVSADDQHPQRLTR